MSDPDYRSFTLPWYNSAKYDQEVANLPAELQQYAAKSKYAARKGLGLSPADLQAANAQNQMNIANYEKYESIPAQVEQMKQAGLNPALMYGGSNGAQSVPEASVDAGTAAGVGVSDPASLLTSVIGMMTSSIQDTYSALGMKEQLEGLRLDNENKRSDIAKKAEETRKIQIENNIANATFDEVVRGAKIMNDLHISQKNSADKNIELIDQKIKESIATINKIDSDIEVNGSTISKNKAQEILANAQAALARVDASERVRLNDSIIRLQDAQSRLANSSADLTDEQVKNYGKVIEKMNAEIVSILAKAGLDKQLFDAYENVGNASVMAGLFNIIASLIPGGNPVTDPRLFSK